MSKRKTPAQALEEFLSYYDECTLEYRYACDKVVEEDKRLQDFLHEMEFARIGTKGTGSQQAFNRAGEPDG